VKRPRTAKEDDADIQRLINRHNARKQIGFSYYNTTDRYPQAWTGPARSRKMRTNPTPKETR
jgi:hypothetical protein